MKKETYCLVCKKYTKNNSSVKWTVLAHFGSQPRGQNFRAQT